MSICLLQRRAAAFAVRRGALLGKTTTSRPLFVRTMVAASTDTASDASSLPRRSIKDKSAASLSRAPFQAPKNSKDDSVSSSKTVGPLAWTQLGLLNELSDCVALELKLDSPTPVQNLVIPALLKDEKKKGVAFLAATGSGKTLAYLLPLMQALKSQEYFENYERRIKRPRLLVLAPTRELATQILKVIKQLGHACKLASEVVVGGEDYGKQRKRLNRNVDILVATPGRLIKHWKDQNVFLGSVQTVVLDEMDTMLEQGFQVDLQQILHPLLYQSKIEVTKETPLVETAPRIILTSATMTQQVQKLIHVDNFKSSKVGAKRHYTKPTLEKTTIVLPQLRVITAPGLHRAVPRLKQVFVNVGNTDKLTLLLDVVSSGSRGAAISTSKADASALTLVFCNTVSSCRAAQHALAEAGHLSECYHGELNSIKRAENLEKFRHGQVQILVCTDLAARGLDVPEVDHVVMFDFPLNALDYLHRAGRTARGVTSERQGNGRVTALVAKRDTVLAKAIEQAVQKGEPLDGLSSRKSDYVTNKSKDNGPTGKRRGRNRNSGQQKQQQQQQGGRRGATSGGRRGRRR